MMGSNEKPQDELFYAFNLEELVPRDRLLRSIDCFLDFTGLHEHLAFYYSRLRAMPFEAIVSRATSRFFERSATLDLAGEFTTRPSEMNQVADVLVRRASKESAE